MTTNRKEDQAPSRLDLPELYGLTPEEIAIVEGEFAK